jgi:hypothetical protein
MASNKLQCSSKSLFYKMLGLRDNYVMHEYQNAQFIDKISMFNDMAFFAFPWTITYLKRSDTTSNIPKV